MTRPGAWRCSGLAPSIRRLEEGRDPRQGHTVAQIVQAAIDLADTVGISSVSMRRVAQHLGVGTMSLYTYIPGKAELLDVMLDTVYGETVSALTAGDGVIDWNGWRGTTGPYRHHPWLLQVATGRPPMGPDLIAKYERELAAVEGVGLSDVEMDSVITLVNGFVHGAARGAADATAVAAQTGLTDEQWWGAIAPYLDKVFDASGYPLAARVGAAAGEEHGAAYDFEHAFEFGLARLLDGVEVLVRSRAGR